MIMIWADIRDKFPKCSRNRDYRLQKGHQLYSVRKKTFKICSTDSDHDLPVAENILDREFDISEPGTVWVTDITQFNTLEGRIYQATVKDLCDQQIVGWSAADNMRKELCLDALDNAVKRHRPAPADSSFRLYRRKSYAYQSSLADNKMIAA